MENKDIPALLQKYKAGNCTPNEKALLESWYLQHDPAAIRELQPEELEADLQQIGIGLPLYSPGKSKRLWPRIAAAASILLLLSFGAYFVIYKHQVPSQKIAQKDIAPGSNSATLTLGNGKTIVLNGKQNGQLAVQGNMLVNKTAGGLLKYKAIAGAGNEVMVNTVTTKRKEQYSVVLSDGTTVWLNAASSIKYPTVFTGKNREVEITGEAYFEVVHDKAKPFRVVSNGQTVEVLGTHFNINSYDDEQTVKTTLLAGSVRIIANSNLKILKPGQQSTVQGNTINLSDVDVDEVVAWKEGYFEFADTDIQSVMRQISRWYDVDIQFEGLVTRETFTGRISRFRNISQVLKIVEASKSVNITIQGRRIMIKQ
jgi:transmembrane sensor